MSLKQEQLTNLHAALTARHVALTTEIRGEVARAREDTFENVAGEVTDRGEEAVADLLFDLDNAEVSRDLGELRDHRVGAGPLCRRQLWHLRGLRRADRLRAPACATHGNALRAVPAGARTDLRGFTRAADVSWGREG